MIGPVKFELILEHVDEDILIPVVNLLLTIRGVSFQWDFHIRENDEIYQLSIQSYCSDVISKIAELLDDDDNNYSSENLPSSFTDDSLPS